MMSVPTPLEPCGGPIANSLPRGVSAGANRPLGGQPGGRRPFGYTADRRHLDSPEATAIRAAVAAVLAGDPVSAVARAWNRAGPSTVSGVPWSASTLRRILLSGRIAGWVERDGRLVGRGDWPAIISLEEHRQLQAVLTTGDSRVRSYLLTGFVFCARCGHKMAARPVTAGGRHRRRYACDGNGGGCAGVGIAADGLEGHVERLFAEHQAAVGTGLGLAGRGGPGGLAILEARLDQLADMFAAGEVSRTEWQRARGEIVGRLEDQLRAVGSLAAAGAGGASMEDLPFRVRRQLLRRAIASVTVSPRRGGNRFDPTRVQVQWRA